MLGVHIGAQNDGIIFFTELHMIYIYRHTLHLKNQDAFLWGVGAAVTGGWVIGRGTAKRRGPNDFLAGARNFKIKPMSCRLGAPYCPKSITHVSP